MKASKDGAVYKRPDGIVIIDPVKAKGQKQIMDSCPYGVVYWNEEKGVPQKCTLCAHLLDQGWKEPRCVQACPTGALIFGDLDDPKSEVFKLVATGKAQPYKPELGTKPRVYYVGLQMYTKELISGTVILKDKDENAKQAKVTVVDKKTGEKVAAVETNEYGLFEVDGLDAGGEYTITIEYPGYATKTIDVKVEKSTYLGDIFLEKAT